MKKNEHKYQFTPMPVNLTACMDNNCRSMLFTLLQLSSYFENRSKAENEAWDGWFFRSNADLQAQTRLSENLVRATISTLYRIGIVDVKLDVKSKNQTPNRFKVNEAAMLTWEKYNIEDCIKNPDYAIMTDKYKEPGWKPSYLDTSAKATPQSQQFLPQSEDNIDNATNEENTPNTNNKLSAGAHERVSTKPREFLSPEMAEYRQKEDDLMRRFSQVTNWCDFLIYVRLISDLAKDAKSDKVRACTIQRYHGVEKGRIAFFTKKFQADPYQPEAKTFFAWLEKHPQWQ